MPEKDEDAQGVVRNRFGICPCIWQLRVVRSILEGKDVITIAPTGLGKSLTFWMPLLFAEKSVMIVVVPLKTLGSQFADDLNVKLKLPAVMVTKNITDDTLFRDILKLKYRVIIFSPETMVNNPSFEALIQHQQFMRHLLNLTMDEAHTVEEWGSTFRDAYARIGITRHLMCRRVPIHLASATLPENIIQALKYHLNLQADVKIFRLNVDRPNIFLRVKKMEHPANSFHDLAPFLPRDIPPDGPRPKKFLIFFNTRRTAEDAAEYLRNRLPFEQRSRIKWVHAGMTDEFRNAEVHALKVGGVEGECATEAVGMGIDILDIYQVVQYGTPKSLNTWWQRAGRAVRNHALNGIAILIAEPANFDDVKEELARKREEAEKKKRDEGEIQRVAVANAIAAAQASRAEGSRASGSQSKKRKSKTNREQPNPKRRKANQSGPTTSQKAKAETDVFGREIKIEATMDDYINAEKRAEKCRRKVVFRHLGNHNIQPITTQHCCDRCKPRQVVQCCDICNPEYWPIISTEAFDKVTQPRMYNPEAYTRGPREKKLQEDLEKLREDLWAEKLKGNGNGLLPPEALWSQKLLMRIVDLAHYNKITTMEQLRKQVTWHYTEALGPLRLSRAANSVPTLQLHAYLNL
ncbi:hypothetical protein MPER_13058 [Moniliophthora perniciosa FA553]|nr:hypothetical protein MPER_13058 [Moniliophthora perniciosa FA553]